MRTPNGEVVGRGAHAKAVELAAHELLQHLDETSA
jgi:hypothetical protein